MSWLAAASLEVIVYDMQTPPCTALTPWKGKAIILLFNLILTAIN